MVLLPQLQFERPFQWGNRSTAKTTILGMFVSFWVSFTLLGSNLLIAEKIGVFVVPVLLLLFYLFGAHVSGFAGVAAHIVGRKKMLIIGLMLMTVGTIAINFVNSFGLFALIYILMAIGYFPVISITGHLNSDFLGNDNQKRGRGRSCWGTLNYISAAVTASAILLIHYGLQMVWFATSVAALIGAALVLFLMKEEKALKEQPFMGPPDAELRPFYPKLLTQDKAVHFSLPYVLVIAGSISVRMWPVFFLNVWVAAAMVLCGELADGLSGLPQVRFSEWLEKKKKAIQHQIINSVTMYTLVGYSIALLFIGTGITALCIIAAIMIGVAVRVLTYVEIPLSQQDGRSHYTFFFVTAVGQCLGCVVAMVSMTALGITLSLMPFALLLIGIAYYNKKGSRLLF